MLNGVGRGAWNVRHLVVPELVPGEFADHASRIEREFDGWLGFHDENQDWLAEAAPCRNSKEGADCRASRHVGQNNGQRTTSDHRPDDGDDL